MKPKMILARCPGCDHTFWIRRESVMVSGFDQKEKQKLDDQTYFLHECSKCGTLYELLYPFYYRNPKKRFGIAISQAQKIEGLEKDELTIQTDNTIQFYQAYIILEAGLDIHKVMHLKRQLECRRGTLTRLDSYDKENNILWFLENGEMIGVPYPG